MKRSFDKLADGSRVKDVDPEQCLRLLAKGERASLVSELCVFVILTVQTNTYCCVCFCSFKHFFSCQIVKRNIDNI